MEIAISILMALALVLVLALPRISKPDDWRRLCRGAVTVTYEAPLAVQGTTTGPTTAQIANRVNVVSANIIASADGDVAATVTHNLGSDAAALALGKPWVILEPLLSQALTALSCWIIATKTAVVITLTKLGSTGSGNAAAQLRTIIQRPYTPNN